MLDISPVIKTRFNALLVKKTIPDKYCSHYRPVCRFHILCCLNWQCYLSLPYNCLAKYFYTIYLAGSLSPEYYLYSFKNSSTVSPAFAI